MKRLPIDPFLPSMLLVLLGAWLLRDYHLSLDTHPAIAVIFLIQGMMVNNDHLRRGFMSWRVHMVVQFGIFLGFPLMVWVLLVYFLGIFGYAADRTASPGCTAYYNFHCSGLLRTVWRKHGHGFIQCYIVKLGWYSSGASSVTRNEGRNRDWSESRHNRLC